MGLVHGLAEASPDKVTAEQLALDVKYQEDVVGQSTLSSSIEYW